MPCMHEEYAHDLTKVLVIYTRCGVEDTRFEAKASKDTKKSKAKDRPSRGLGQECSRPWPRTKDTISNVFQKKVFKKIFQAISKKKRSSKIFFRHSPIKNAF